MKAAQNKDDSLQTLLFAEEQRENSGGSSWNRHEFHHTWAIVHLLSLHEAGKDYLIALEFHDDVVVLEPSTSPKVVNLFQLKSKPTGRWSQAALLKAEASVNPAKKRSKLTKKAPASPPPAPPLPKSILGKLIAHLRWCSKQVERLTLVSDAPFEFQGEKAATTNLERFCATALHPKSQEEIRIALKKELSLDDEIPLEKLYFQRASFGVRGYEEYAIGYLQKYMEQKYAGRGFRTAALHLTLVTELKRGLRAETTPSTFEELEVFGLRRVTVNSIIQEALQSTPEQWLKDVKDRLNAELYPPKRLAALEDNWRRYMAEKVDESNITHQNFVVCARATVKDVYDSTDFARVTEFLDLAEKNYLTTHGKPELPITMDLLRGGLLYEYKAYETRQSATPNPEPEEGAP